MTVTTTIRISEIAHARLREMAKQRNLSVSRLIDDLLADVEKREFFAGLADDFRRLQADPDEWDDYLRELQEWDAVLSDGLGDQADAR